MSRSRLAILTWISSISFLVVTTFTALFTSPIIVRALGVAQFGVVRSLTEAFAYLTLIAEGITLSLVPSLVAALGRDDRPGAARTLATGLRLYGSAAMVAILVGLMLTPALGHVIRVGPALGSATRTAWLIALLGLPLMVFVPLRLLIQVDQKGYVIQLMMVAQALATVGLSVYLALSGWGVVGVLTAGLFGQVLFYAALIGYVFRNYPDLARGAIRSRPGREDWSGVLSLSGPTLLALVSERVGILSDSLVLAVVIGPEAATILYITQQLASLSKIVLGSIASAVWPGLVELHTRGEHAVFNRRFVEITRLVVLLGVAGMVPVAAYNGHFVAQWQGRSFDGGPAIAAVAGLNGVLLTLGILFSIPFATTGRVAIVAIPSAVAAVLNLVASVVFSKLYGPIGPLLGTTLSLLSVGAWYLPWRLSREFGTSRRGLLWAVIVPVAWGTGYAAVVYWVAGSHTPTGYLMILGEMVGWACGFLALGWVVILDAEDRELWRGRLINPILARIGRKPRPPGEVGNDSARSGAGAK